MRGAWFGLGVVVGLLGGAAALALLRRTARRALYRALGLAEEMRAAAANARAAARLQMREQLLAAANQLRESGAVAGLEAGSKHFVSVQLAVLALLNQENMSSKSFTFWQRRTAKIQADIDKLRVENAQ
jgi:hypothetical protein